jgi:PAS domain S-box-containing protein
MQPPNESRLGSDELTGLIDAVLDYAIFVMGPEGQIRSWNLGAERIFGYPASEAIGKTFTLFYGDDDLAARKPQRELEVAARDGRIEDEGWRLRKDGTRFWANTVITALREKNGKLHGFAQVTRDLSRRREGEERLRQSEEMFRLLVGSVQEYAIFMLDPDGYITSWNAGARRIKGYEPHEIIGRHFSVFYPDEDRKAHKPERELEIARKSGSVIDEGYRVRKDGTTFWASVTITAVFDSTGVLRGFAKVTRDMTERKRAEEAQRALLEQREARLQADEERRRAEASYRVAQEANRAKDEFLMTLSHELRTPMTAILGWARLLPSMSPGDPTFRDAISSIARGAELQAHLIDDVLDVSRIVSGKLRLTREVLDVGRVINAALDAVRPSADARGVRIVTSYSPGLGTVVADPTRLQQVIWNLLTNAVKFTPKEGLIEVSARRTSSHVQITVRDTGEGIEPQFLPHVFEPFRQAENPQTRTHGGLGLGLSIVRYIVEAHGGTVAAESKGKSTGATFTVTLPVDAMVSPSVQQQTHGPEQPVRTIDPRRLAGMDVLLVEDERESRDLIRAVLRAAGASVTASESAADALKYLESAVPDLIITDIAMPQMDGYAFVRELRRRNDTGSMNIVALSAFPAGTADKSGFDAFLAKPIEPADFIDEIARFKPGDEQSA